MSANMCMCACMHACCLACIHACWHTREHNGFLLVFINVCFLAFYIGSRNNVSCTEVPISCLHPCRGFYLLSFQCCLIVFFNDGGSHDRALHFLDTMKKQNVSIIFLPEMCWVQVHDVNGLLCSFRSRVMMPAFLVHWNQSLLFSGQHCTPLELTMSHAVMFWTGLFMFHSGQAC